MIATIKNILQIGEAKLIQLETKADVVEIADCKEVEIKKITHRRSLNANAYFHVLVGKIADAVSVSKAYAKNLMLGRYGQREISDNGEVTFLVRSDIDMMEREDIHTVPIGYEVLNDTEFTNYAVVRGSHTYTSKEMQVLIDGVVSDAKEIGIETLTPQELERIYQSWKRA